MDIVIRTVGVITLGFIVLVLPIVPPILIILHGFIRWWRKHPWQFYVVPAGLLVVNYFLLVPVLGGYFLGYEYPLLQFGFTRWLYEIPIPVSYYTAVTIVVASWGLIIWSILSLGVRRFFYWDELRRRSIPNVMHGPYRFLKHPAYVGYIGLVMGLFVSAKEDVYIVFLIYLIIGLYIASVLENRELKTRRGTA